MYKKEEPIKERIEEEETLEEGRGHGDTKAVKKLMKQAINDGLVDIKEVKKGWLVQSKVDDSQELIHRGEKAFHYLRRFLNKIS